MFVVQRTDNDVMLVTGATGLVGSHVIERARNEGWRVQALVRSPSSAGYLKEMGAELLTGDFSDPGSVAKVAADATVIVHCAAKIGDWGPVEEYRKINVQGLDSLLDAAERSGKLKRFVHVSSLGVYEARDHYGTDEDEPPNVGGIDGYTGTKVEAEQLVLRHVKERRLPAVAVRPGFIYGPRDRTILPQLMTRLKTQKFAYLGSPDKLMNNTYVGNLVDAIFLSIEKDTVLGQVFNITDPRLVTKKEFMETIAKTAGYPVPTAVVPLGVAKFLAKMLEGLYRLLGKKEAPLLSSARIKFLGLNLDYSIDRARRLLGYNPKFDFADAMPMTVRWFLEHP